MQYLPPEDELEIAIERTQARIDANNRILRDEPDAAYMDVATTVMVVVVLLVLVIAQVGGW